MMLIKQRNKSRLSEVISIHSALKVGQLELYRSTSESLCIMKSFLLAPLIRVHVYNLLKILNYSIGIIHFGYTIISVLESLSFKRSTWKLITAIVMAVRESNDRSRRSRRRFPVRDCIYGMAPCYMQILVCCCIRNRYIFHILVYTKRD